MKAGYLPVVLAGLLVVAAVIFAMVLLTGGNGSEVDLAVNEPGETGAVRSGGFVTSPVRSNYEPPEAGSYPSAVVSAHELATQSGMRILEQGGTAADAAVAVAATLSVVEPWFSSALGGGTWALYFDAETGRVTSLDGVGTTGTHATVTDYEPRAGAGGIHQSIVPGAWDGWMLWLREYGRMDLGEVLQPAIEVAREGYTISGPMASWLERSDILGRPDTAAIYASNGVVMGQGATVRQEDLADTLEALAGAYEEALEGGRDEAIQAARDYYYRGPLAEAIVDFSDANGGYLALEDFQAFEAAIVDPIAVQYRDYTVYQNPPNSQGITMLMALKILEGFDIGGLDPLDPETLHLQVEALKLAFADRNEHVGDPARVDIPVERLLSEEHATAQRDRIAMDGALTAPLESQLQARDGELEEDIGDTSTFHVVDADGNAAAVTTSLGAQFLVVGDTGINMNNRMRFLHMDEDNPNALEPGDKVRHTSNPYMAFHNGELAILGGNTGVDTQPQAQVQQFINIVEFGLTAQEAVDHPRFSSNAFAASTYPNEAPNTLDLEGDIPDEVVDALREQGHEISEGGGIFGTAGVLVVDDGGSSVQVGVDGRNGTSGGDSEGPDPEQ